MDTEASESSDHSCLLNAIVRKGKKILKMKKILLILVGRQFLGKTEKGEQKNKGWKVYPWGISPTSLDLHIKLLGFLWRLYRG